MEFTYGLSSTMAFVTTIARAQQSSSLFMMCTTLRFHLRKLPRVQKASTWFEGRGETFLTRARVARHRCQSAFFRNHG